ncbi:MAG: L,D-transpeptidase family protein [Betaproteobacteria bacterium]|nr:L,D-transpeptidase family protein [Betaproteobacteria bacterium]
MGRAIALRLALAALLACAPFGRVLAQALRDHDPLELDLSGVVNAVERNQLDLALRRVDALLAAHPTFRLGYLIRGDLLLARTRPLRTFGNAAATMVVPNDKLEGLRAEALARLRALRDRPSSTRMPQYVLQLSPEEKYALVVDSKLSRLYVFQNVDGLPRYVADYYVTLGKRGVDKMREGDEKTPIGVYHVTAHLPRQKLTDFYGVGAFPLNYPNSWDRSQGRSGHGIWLHGTPSDTYSRPPRASNGCIVLANPDLESLARFVRIDQTPVIIADQIDWTSAASLEAERRSLAAAVEAWRRDWQSRDAARYLSHYSRRFHSDGEDYAQWAAHKRQVNSAKAWIKVDLSDVSMLRYPRERFVVVSFTQDYRSNNLSNVMSKKQYWAKEGGAWKIIYEGPAGAGPGRFKERYETVRSVQAAGDAVRRGRRVHGLGG